MSSQNQLGDTNDPTLCAIQLANLLSQVQMNQVPGLEEFKIVEDDKRPTVPHDECADLPVLDFSDVKADDPTMAKRVVEACAEWGFFQVVNHCVPVEAMDDILAIGDQFFSLPLEEKRKVGRTGLFGYIADFRELGMESLSWCERMMLYVNPESQLDSFLHKVWPDGNPDFCNALANYLTSQRKLRNQILELLALGFGLETNFFLRHFGPDSAFSEAVRWNNYPPCPHPLDIVGTPEHTDGSFLTMLQEDAIGGLQIRKNGQWLGVKPIRGAIVINCGDFMQVWTNERSRSVEHRSVLNTKCRRRSFATFYNAGGDVIIHSPPELVDKQHPLAYKPLTRASFRRYYEIIYKETKKLPRGLAILEEYRILHNVELLEHKIDVDFRS